MAYGWCGMHCQPTVSLHLKCVFACVIKCLRLFKTFLVLLVTLSFWSSFCIDFRINPFMSFGLASPLEHPISLILFYWLTSCTLVIYPHLKIWREEPQLRMWHLSLFLSNLKVLGPALSVASHLLSGIKADHSIISWFWGFQVRDLMILGCFCLCELTFFS